MKPPGGDSSDLWGAAFNGSPSHVRSYCLLLVNILNRRFFSLVFTFYSQEGKKTFKANRNSSRPFYFVAMCNVFCSFSFRVLKPPGGGSSDIFGTAEPIEQQRKVKSHLTSSIFEAETTAPTRSKAGKSTFSNIFGDLPDERIFSNTNKKAVEGVTSTETAEETTGADETNGNESADFPDSNCNKGNI